MYQAKIVHALKKGMLVALTFLSASSIHAQQAATVIHGKFDKAFDGYVEVFVQKKGVNKKYGTNQLYSYQKHYAIAVPAGKDESITLRFVSNTMKNFFTNDTVYTNTFKLSEPTNLKLDLNYHPATAKYVPGKISELPFGKINPSDSFALLYCSFDTVTVNNTRLLASRNLMPDEKSSVLAASDKSVLTHVLAVSLSHNELLDLECSRMKTRLYVRPGETISLLVSGKTAEDISYNIDQPSDENKLLKQWFDLSKPVSKFGYFSRIFTKTLPTAERFLADYAKVEALAKTLLANNISKNASFNDMLKSMLAFDLEFSALVYLEKLNKGSMVSTYFSKFTGYKTVPDAMKRFAKSSKLICDEKITTLYDYQNYVYLFSNLWETMYPVTDLPVIKDPNLNKWQLNNLCTKEAKSVYLYLELLRYKRVCTNRYDFAAKFVPYKDYLLTDEMLVVYNDAYGKYFNEASNINTAIRQIVMPDTSGNMIDISTAFKGKVVLFDIWGTWCGPCRMQVPYWSKLVKEYKDNPNIVFVAIGFQKNDPYWINAWKQYIRENDFPGIHLLDKDGKSFYTPLQLASPGYMLLGKDGKWIEMRCPKPELKDQLKALLDKALAVGTNESTPASN